MKKLIALCSLTLLVSIAIAGGNKTNPIPFDSATQKFAYRKIVEVPGATANALYLRSKNWSKVKFADEKFLIDEPDAKLTTLGNFTVNVTMKAMMKIPFVVLRLEVCTSIVFLARWMAFLRIVALRLEPHLVFLILLMESEGRDQLSILWITQIASDIQKIVVGRA